MRGLADLKPGGVLVLLDTPVYRDASSGAQMVRERETQFQKEYGFASNALASENYLTRPRLKELGQVLNVRWNLVSGRLTRRAGNCAPGKPACWGGANRPSLRSTPRSPGRAG